MTRLKDSSIRNICLILCIPLITLLFIPPPSLKCSEIERVDEDIFRWINGSFTSDTMDAVMTGASFLGNGFGAIGEALLIATLDKENGQESARLILYSVAGTGLVVQLLKHTIRRPRPGLALEGVRFNGGQPVDRLSFPSGHSATAFSVATVLAEKYPEQSGLFWVLATVAGVSRVYNGAHFPSDVLAGAVIGWGGTKLILRAYARNKEQKLSLIAAPNGCIVSISF